MDERHSQSLGLVIGAIGHPHFAEVVGRSLCHMTGFDLSSLVVHRATSRPELVFDDLSSAGYATGIQNYLRRTYRTNPMLLARASEGPYRASDFRVSDVSLKNDLAGYLIPSPEEELGFRTVGWPRRLEEVGLIFRACGGMVELSLYRERGRTAASATMLQTLTSMRIPLIAAFERHEAVGKRASSTLFPALTNREREITELLLAGCSSEAVALRLGISRHTVKDHRKAIFRKLRIGSLAELFRLSHAGSAL